MKKVYIAAYPQSKFGRLMAMTVPEIVASAVTETFGEIGVEPSAVDVGSIGATCNFSLNEQGKVPAQLQVPNPKLAATFNIGGPICASVCTVLRPA